MRTHDSRSATFSYLDDSPADGCVTLLEYNAKKEDSWPDFAQLVTRVEEACMWYPFWYSDTCEGCGNNHGISKTEFEALEVTLEMMNGGETGLQVCSPPPLNPAPRAFDTHRALTHNLMLHTNDSKV